jgi:hypothetical protein
MRPSAELRNEAIALFALTDARVGRHSMTNPTDSLLARLTQDVRYARARDLQDHRAPSTIPDHHPARLRLSRVFLRFSPTAGICREV